MSNVQKKQRTRFLSLRVKLLIGFTVLFTIVFAGAYYWFYSFITQRAIEHIRVDMLDMLNIGIKGIDGDEFATMAQDAKVEASGMPDSDPRYQRHQDWLRKIREVDERTSPYTFIASGKPYEVLWIGDIFRIIRPADQTKFRESYDSSQSLLYNGLTETTVRMTPQPDKWGTWVSAYGPIRNSRGEVVGGFGMDFRYDYVLEVQQTVLNNVGIAFLITYITLFVLIFAYSRVLTRPIVYLTRASRRIAEGDYNVNLATVSGGLTRDEIGVLADMFQIMTNKVREREQTLIRQVEELKIEVDEAKSKKQVKEIVESDFFQQLEAKARRMRDRSAATTGKFAAVKRSVLTEEGDMGDEGTTDEDKSAVEDKPVAEGQPAGEIKGADDQSTVEDNPAVEEKPTM
jgi:HAMP domain-containing protein